MRRGLRRGLRSCWLPLHTHHSLSAVPCLAASQPQADAEIGCGRWSNAQSARALAVWGDHGGLLWRAGTYTDYSLQHYMRSFAYLVCASVERLVHDCVYSTVSNLLTYCTVQYGIFFCKGQFSIRRNYNITPSLAKVGLFATTGRVGQRLYSTRLRPRHAPETSEHK